MANEFLTSNPQFTKAFADDKTCGSMIMPLAQIAKINMQLLVKLLRDESSYENRVQAAYALGQIGKQFHKDIVPALIWALGDVDEGVCQQVANALAQMGNLAVLVLTEALEDTNEEVRFNATCALDEMSEPAKEAVPALIKALRNDENQGVQWVAFEVLQKIATPEALKAVEAYKEQH